MRLRASLLLWALLSLLALVALAACGSTSGGFTSIGSSGGFATAPATAVKPCPGGLSGVTDAGQPNLILTEATKSGDARVGQIVQVRLAANYRWSMAEPFPSLATQINGDYDEHAGVCFWTFKVVSADSVTVTFNGAILCEPQSACPGLVRSETFTVTIT